MGDSGTGAAERELLADMCARSWAYGVCTPPALERWFSPLLEEHRSMPSLFESALVRLALRPNPLADPAAERALILRLVQAFAAGESFDGSESSDRPPGSGSLGGFDSTLRAGFVYSNWVTGRLGRLRPSVRLLIRPNRNPTCPLPLLILADRCLAVFPTQHGLFIVPEPVGLVLAGRPGRDVVAVDGLSDEVVETTAALAADPQAPLASLPDALNAARLLVP